MTAAMLNITVPVSASAIISVLDSYARKMGLHPYTLNSTQCLLRCSVELAYELVEQLIQGADSNKPAYPTVNTLTPMPRQFNPPQTSEQKRLLVVADTLSLAIAQTIASTAQQNGTSIALPLDYSLPRLPLKYFFPFDKSDIKNRNTVYLFGRSVKLPPTRALILEQLLQVPEKELVRQQSLVDFTYGVRGLTSEEVWHAHMSYLRSAVAPELILETERGVGYRVVVSRQPFARY